MPSSENVLVWYPNPALDHAIEVHPFKLGQVQRAVSEKYSAGGKGANVLRALRLLATSASGVTILGGLAGMHYEALIKAEKLRVEFTRLPGSIRTATLISDRASGADTVVNGPGAVLTDDGWREHINQVMSRLKDERPHVFVLAGSAPVGSNTADVTEVLLLANRIGAQTLVDTSQNVLLAALAANPGLVKVNLDEAVAALSLSGMKQTAALSTAQVMQAIRHLGARSVIITDGAGPVEAWIGGHIRVIPEPIEAVTSVGCGDAFFAAFISATVDGMHPEEAVNWATAVGTAAAEMVEPGSFNVHRATVLNFENPRQRNEPRS